MVLSTVTSVENLRHELEVERKCRRVQEEKVGRTVRLLERARGDKRDSVTLREIEQALSGV